MTDQENTAAVPVPLLRKTGQAVEVESRVQDYGQAHAVGLLLTDRGVQVRIDGPGFGISRSVDLAAVKRFHHRQVDLPGHRVREVAKVAQDIHRGTIGSGSDQARWEAVARIALDVAASLLEIERQERQAIATSEYRRAVKTYGEAMAEDSTSPETGMFRVLSEFVRNRAAEEVPEVAARSPISQETERARIDAGIPYSLRLLAGAAAELGFGEDDQWRIIDSLRPSRSRR